MARAGLPVFGRTLGLAEGSADLRRRLGGYTVRRATLTGIAVAALIAGVAATSAALHGEADTGVVAFIPDGSVLSVSPTGLAWRYGIRAGQLVVAITRATDPGGWRIETEAGGVHYVALASPADEALRDSLPLGVGGMSAGALAIVFLRTHRRWVLLAASLALVASSTPLWLEGHPELSTVALAGAALVPGGWLVWRVPGGAIPRLVACLGLAGLLAAWAIARLSGSTGYDQLETARASIAMLGILGLLADRAVMPIFAGERLTVARPRLFDIAGVAALAGIALALVYFLEIPPVLVSAALIIAILFLAPLRRRLGGPVSDVFLADIRAHAAIQGAEAERDRLARQLHDVPLQELVGVIRRLEVLPGARAESDDLRALASHLRDVAADLRPPVIDDFGLSAALEYVAEDATSASLPVRAEIKDGTGFGRRQRPPAEVELEIFRITREAVANAVLHSGATNVRIEAEVVPARVQVSVIDDGTGIDAAKAHEAGRRKRMGLSSMRRRAQAIDAELTIDGGRQGTTITVTWQA
jgi:signal transduction histidine kinase